MSSAERCSVFVQTANFNRSMKVAGVHIWGDERKWSGQVEQHWLPPELFPARPFFSPNFLFILPMSWAPLSMDHGCLNFPRSSRPKLYWPEPYRAPRPIGRNYWRSRWRLEQRPYAVFCGASASISARPEFSRRTTTSSLPSMSASDCAKQLASRAAWWPGRFSWSFSTAIKSTGAPP